MQKIVKCRIYSLPKSKLSIDVFNREIKLCRPATRNTGDIFMSHMWHAGWPSLVEWVMSVANKK